MSILIKNMKMPKACVFCELYDGEMYWCRGAKKEVPYSPEEKRAKFCPLSLIPPHGRLIDADALEDRCSRQARDEWNKSTGTNWGYAYATFESDVEDAPTIIEAEEGE